MIFKSFWEVILPPYWYSALSLHINDCRQRYALPKVQLPFGYSILLPFRCTPNSIDQQMKNAILLYDIFFAHTFWHFIVFPAILVALHWCTMKNFLHSSVTHSKSALPANLSPPLHFTFVCCLPIFKKIKSHSEWNESEMEIEQSIERNANKQQQEPQQKVWGKKSNRISQKRTATEVGVWKMLRMRPNTAHVCVCECMVKMTKWEWKNKAMKWKLFALHVSEVEQQTKEAKWKDTTHCRRSGTAMRKTQHNNRAPVTGCWMAGWQMDAQRRAATNGCRDSSDCAPTAATTQMTCNSEGQMLQQHSTKKEGKIAATTNRKWQNGVSSTQRPLRSCAECLGLKGGCSAGRGRMAAVTSEE